MPPVELPDPAPLFASSVLCASLGSLCLGYRVGAWHQDVSAAPYRRVLIGLVASGGWIDRAGVACDSRGCRERWCQESGVRGQGWPAGTPDS